MRAISHRRGRTPAEEVESTPRYKGAGRRSSRGPLATPAQLEPRGARGSAEHWCITPELGYFLPCRALPGRGQTRVTTATAAASFDREALDQILTLQLLVAWAGEADTDPPKLGWWRTALADEFGGEDLFQRLMPHTWRWAVLDAARLAAKRVDARSRERTADADQLVSLFRFGFALDEHLDDRLAELKRSGVEPVEALPGLKAIASAWDRVSFDAWLADLPVSTHTASPTGRRLKGAPPDEPVLAARMLCAALRPLGESYPAPHFRTAR